MWSDLATPIAIVVAVVVQTTAIGYFAGTIRQILRDHERRLTRLEPE